MLNMHYDDKNLLKVKDNKPQSLLSGEERNNNVKNVYKLKNALKFRGKKVLLVDDIFTTGNTVNECSKTLREADAKLVGIFTIARD